MIRAIVRLGQWLDSRFPQKLVVTVASYADLNRQIHSAHVELASIQNTLSDITLSLNKTLERVSTLENAAVHKGAVQDVIVVVGKLKEELSALRFGLGMTAPVSSKDAEIKAILNGQPLGDESNG